MNIITGEGKSTDQTVPPDFVHTFWIFCQIIKRFIRNEVYLGTLGVFLVLPSFQASYTTNNHNRISKDLIKAWRVGGPEVGEK